MKSYHCIVEGKVTGGNFQSWCLDTAQLLKLNGWVRNIDNNKAEIMLQGDADSYASFRRMLKDEAPIPEIKEISCNPMTHDKTYDKFEMRG